MKTELLYYIVFILGIGIYISDKVNWVDVYGGSQSNLYEVQSIYTFLKKNDVKCKLKISNQRFHSGKNSQAVTGVIKVKRSDRDKAYKLISDYSN
ncbi:hypothetical protein PRVXT_002304 [Proteinivorax tanatarense]|uniref:Uncharacterized protein n=1 Tax=Proteinivorax tanatarense TaxID=1260629 RepID=A0AAU7VJP1_9FIRM